MPPWTCPLTYWPDYQQGSSFHQGLSAMSLLDFSPRIPLGTFSILLPAMFEASGAKRSWVISCTWCETNISFDLEFWPIDIIINREYKLITAFSFKCLISDRCCKSWSFSYFFVSSIYYVLNDCVSLTFSLQKYDKAYKLQIWHGIHTFAWQSTIGKVKRIICKIWMKCQMWPMLISIAKLICHL